MNLKIFFTRISTQKKKFLQFSFGTARRNKSHNSKRQKYFPSFSVDDVKKIDLFANKNSKYLFYKFNDWIESVEGEKLII